MRRNDVFLILILVLVLVLVVNKYYHKERNSGKVVDVLVPEERIGENKTDGEEKEQRDKDHELIKLETGRQNAITKAVGIVQPAVVSVNVIKTEIVRRYINPFDNPFFGFFDNVPYRREVQGIGSGVIISEDGYIVTNAHVVEGATKLSVSLPDGRQFEGTLIGFDSIHDLAVLKIEGRSLPCAQLGSSHDLIIGEWAIAVGNPYGLLIKDSRPSVSVGVISALDRNFGENKDGKIYRKMIQTDAAINPGNSGGPLVNIYGEVVGINTFIFSETGGNIGIAFSIPIDRVKKITGELIEHGKIRDIWFGFKVQDITPILASYLNLNNTDGVIVNIVDKNGPAEQAGLLKGDIIIEINSNYIKDANAAELAVTDIAVGDEIVIKALRNGQEVMIEIVAIEYINQEKK
ncbi:MAG: trypsin-like peptidase domain-containing protein [Candidatus Cloacimonetes bacterium]|nr:trypsin-like peptidase domain-containing protein [Candidatus Cloacimonadota bacterium]